MIMSKSRKVSCCYKSKWAKTLLGTDMIVSISFTPLCHYRFWVVSLVHGPRNTLLGILPSEVSNMRPFPYHDLDQTHRKDSARKSQFIVHLLQMVSGKDDDASLFRLSMAGMILLGTFCCLLYKITPTDFQKLNVFGSDRTTSLSHPVYMSRSHCQEGSYRPGVLVLHTKFLAYGPFDFVRRRLIHWFEMCCVLDTFLGTEMQPERSKLRQTSRSGFET